MSLTDPIVFWPSLVVFLVVFFLPTIIAFRQRNRRRWWILLCNLFGMSLVPWLFAWALLLPPKGFLRRTSAPAAHGSHSCPSCGGAVNLEDYLPSASEIGCSHCNARFSRSAASIASIALLLVAIGVHAEPAQKIDVKFPPGFEVEGVKSGKHDAADRDVHVAAAAHPSGCRVDLFFDSSVPLTNDQIPAFGQQLMASSAERLPSMRLGSPGVVSEKAVQIFFVTYMLRDASKMGMLMVRSFSGSPLRTMVHCPKGAASELVLMPAIEHMLRALADASP